MTFLDRLNSPKFDFTQNQSGSKIIKFQQSLALTSHFESFWSIVECHSALLFGIKCLECFLVSYFSFLSGDQLLLIPTPLQIDSKDFIMKKWIIRKNRPKIWINSREKDQFWRIVTEKLKLAIYYSVPRCFHVIFVICVKVYMISLDQSNID